MRAIARYKAWRSGLPFKFLPPLVDLLTKASTFRAQKIIQERGGASALVDVTVLYHAVVMESGWINTGPSSWGSQEISTGYMARVPVRPDDDNSPEARSIRYLPGIASLFRRSHLSLFSSSELEDEQYRQPSGRYGGYGYYDFTLLHPNQLKSIDGHIFPQLGPSWLKSPPLHEQQRCRIDSYRKDDTFDELVRTLGQKNSQDAWHLYTAEKYGLDYFVTMDFKFLRTIAAQKNSRAISNLKTKAISPEELGSLLKLIPISPRLFAYHNASFPVRADLTFPEGKRAPLSSYKKNPDR